MPIHSTLCMIFVDIPPGIIPLIIYPLLGVMICVLALPERKLAACLALVAPSIIFLSSDVVTHAVTDSVILGIEASGVLFKTGLLGGPILFFALILIVGLSRDRKRKKLLLVLSVLGLISSVAIFKTIEYGLGQIP